MSNKHFDEAYAIAELHSFMSPLFIWKMIWEEVIPRGYDEKKAIHTDTYEVLTSVHGFSNLLALWYICSELYQGIAPAKAIIQKQLEVAPGLGKGSFSATIRTLNTILGRFVSPDQPAGASCLGWFVERQGQDLAKAFGHIKDGDETDEERTVYKDSVRYIYYANDLVEVNITAIMKTALAVGKTVRSQEFMDKLAEDMKPDNIISSEVNTHDFLNKTSGNSLRLRYANLILAQLRKHKFQDKNAIDKTNKSARVEGKEPVIARFAHLRKRNEPLHTFRNYDLTESYPSTIRIP